MLFAASLLASSNCLLLTVQPLQIKSVIAKEGLRGYIYIEAFKQTHVKQIIEGVGNLIVGRWKQMVSSIITMLFERFIGLSVCLSVCLFVCLFVCMSVCICLFLCLF